MAANVDTPRGDGLTEAEMQQLAAWEAKPGDMGEWERGMLWGFRLRANGPDAERVRRLQQRVKEARSRKAKPKPRREPERQQDDEDVWYDFFHPEDRR